MKGKNTNIGKAPPRIRGGEPTDLKVSQAVEAVCDELGITDRRGRALIARRVNEAYRRGPRQPLNLVHAGLGAC
ncbi:MAG: hypothetical protein WDZ83_15335 [Rhizobiaceae bacterium]